MRLLLSLATVGVAHATAERPLAKVISLLKNMAKELEAQKKDDDAVYKKFQCFCTKNEEEQNAKFKAASEAIKMESAAKEKADGETQAKGIEFQEKSDEKQKKTEALAELEGQCGKKSEEWVEEEAKSVTEINQLKGAITVLKKHNFLQSTSKVMSADVKEAIFNIANGSTGQRLGESSPSRLATLLSFVRPDEMMGTPDSPTSFLQVPGVQSYANQSGQIFGILEQMLEDMERDYEQAKKERQNMVDSCGAGRENLNKEQELLTETLQALDERRGELAAASAAAQENLNLATQNRNDAREFLADLNEKCEQNKADYKSRTEGRAAELKAIYDTIPILDNDDAFAAFGRVGTTKSQAAVAFIQLRSEGEIRSLNNEIRAKALETLNKLQNKHAGTMLVQYLLNAAAPDKGALGKVIDKIDLLHSELQVKLEQERVDHKGCIDEGNEITQGMETKTLERTNAQNNMDESKAKIEEETAALKALEEAAAALNAKVAEEGSLREEAAQQYNKEYSETKSVIDILQKAIDRMSQTYVQKFDPNALIQQPGALNVGTASTATNAGSGPAAFTGDGETKQSEGGNKVVSLLKDIQNDTTASLKLMEDTEADAQAAYTEFVELSTRQLETNAKDHAQHLKQLAEGETNLAQAEKDFKLAEESLGKLLEQEELRHKRCHFLLGNFDTRQTMMKQEQEGLMKAKQILSEALA